MNIYLAVSITNSHNPVLLKQVVDHLHDNGHRVLSEHVAAPNKVESTKVLATNAGFFPEFLETLDAEDVALLIRSSDFDWVERCDAFIALFFGGSDGRGAEFEHLRLLMELKRNQMLGGSGRGDLLYKKLQCQGILGLFDKKHCSRLIWASNLKERAYYWRVFVDPNSPQDIIEAIDMFLCNLERKKVANA